MATGKTRTPPPNPLSRHTLQTREHALQGVQGHGPLTYARSVAVLREVSEDLERALREVGRLRGELDGRFEQATLGGDV